jgi:predicted RNA polymerase sigma factor
MSSQRLEVSRPTASGSKRQSPLHEFQIFYHVAAAIAAVHCAAARMGDTDWDRIVWLYDQLMLLRPSPVVALNRAIAIAYRDGPQQGIDAIAAIAESDRLEGYPFYSAALGELEMMAGHPGEARCHFEAALSLARNAIERRFLTSRMVRARGE